MFILPCCRHDREFLQRGRWRLAGYFMELVEQEQIDQVQACNDSSQGVRLLRYQGPRGPLFQFR